MAALRASCRPVILYPKQINAYPREASKKSLRGIWPWNEKDWGSSGASWLRHLGFLKSQVSAHRQRSDCEAATDILCDSISFHEQNRHIPGHSAPLASPNSKASIWWHLHGCLGLETREKRHSLVAEINDWGSSNVSFATLPNWFLSGAEMVSAWKPL